MNEKDYFTDKGTIRCWVNDPAGLRKEGCCRLNALLRPRVGEGYGPATHPNNSSRRMSLSFIFST